MTVLLIRAHKRFGVCRGIQLRRDDGRMVTGLLIEVSLEGVALATSNLTSWLPATSLRSRLIRTDLCRRMCAGSATAQQDCVSCHRYMAMNWLQSLRSAEQSSTQKMASLKPHHARGAGH